MSSISQFSSKMWSFEKKCTILDQAQLHSKEGNISMFTTNQANMSHLQFTADPNVVLASANIGKWVTGFKTVSYRGYLTESDLEKCPKPYFNMDFLKKIKMMCSSTITLQKNCSQRHTNFVHNGYSTYP